MKSIGFQDGNKKLVSGFAQVPLRFTCASFKGNILVYRLIRTLLIGILFIALPGCGLFFDYNGVEQESAIIGKIKIRRLENSFDLVYNETERMIAPIIRNCSVVYYDSLNSIILADEKLNNYNRKFNKFYIKDANNSDIEQALTLTEITAEEFNNSKNDKMKKWSVNNNE